jgi:hypothetical protein
MLIVDDEVVEHAHHRQHGRQRRLLEDRQARRAVAVIDLEDPAGFPRQRLARLRCDAEASRKRRRC